MQCVISVLWFSMSLVSHNTSLISQIAIAQMTACVAASIFAVTLHCELLKTKV